jgi:hypothetical protein
MATRQTFTSQLIRLSLYLVRKLSRRRESTTPKVYLAYSIGPEVLAVSVYELDARSDKDALAKAAPLFRDELNRIEVWCGSRKVGDIPPKRDEFSDDGAIRDSA